jgi:acyl carrier protein
VDQIYETTTVRKVFDLYGPSEYTTYSTFVLREKHGNETIGRPIANTRVYILRCHFALVPAGVAGELFIAGAGLARGYLDRPDLTAERFVPDPFSGESGERMYRTGDLGRYLPDGRIEFLGRVDRQVKLRGFRIELNEIEMVLRDHDCVGQVIVVMREDQPGQKHLAAYVVPADEKKPSTRELRNYLKEKLPDHMVPSFFIVLERFPLTTSGKIDRNALLRLDAIEADNTFVTPHTAPEQLLAQIWQQILKRDRIGIHDNFFETGGHSLLATQMISRIRKTFNVEVPLRSLFVAPTIAGFVEILSKEVGGGEVLAEVALTVLEVEKLSDTSAASLLEKLQGETRISVAIDPARKLTS